ncbi:MAG: APC family permease [Oscillospiraceae bacterium]|nr:APC family permease [Oscillospiraceae bacterium]
MSNKLEKKYGLLTAICMVVGIVVGSGVFFKAQTILEKTNGDMPLGILAWVIGGVIMIFCILAFSVMAQKYEKVNGVVDYAEATIGGKYAYMVGWFMTTIYYPTLTSVLAWLSARYTLVFICSVNPDFAMHIAASDGGCVYGPECLALSCLFLVASYAVNALSPKLAGKFQVSATFIKLVPLLRMAVVGTIYGLTHNMAGSADSILIENFKTASGNTSVLFGAVVATAFAYEGWIIATSINAELKNAKRNLPIALVSGGIIIIAVYIFYYIGVAGGADVATLQKDGATVAFTNVFGNVLGNILNLFVAVSCMGTLNGLMLGCTRGIYSVAVRGYGPAPKVYSEISKHTNMPTNSSIFGVLLCAFWLVYFFGANLTPKSWFGLLSFDSSELPIVTTYALYIPIFIFFMKKAKDVNPFKRFVLPALAVIGSLFMVFAAVYSHGIAAYQAAAAEGKFACPVLFYLIIFAVIMVVGLFFGKKKSTD